jgi:hypothetical protein
MCKKFKNSINLGLTNYQFVNFGLWALDPPLNPPLGTLVVF